MTISPERGETPAAELELLNAWIRKTEGEVIVDFEGRNDSRFLTARRGAETLSPDIGDRFTGLAELLIENEMGDWSHRKGATGSLRFDGKMPWLDADSVEDDWTYGRSIDEDDLMSLVWDEETPSP